MKFIRLQNYCVETTKIMSVKSEDRRWVGEEADNVIIITLFTNTKDFDHVITFADAKSRDLAFNKLCEALENYTV